MYNCGQCPLCRAVWKDVWDRKEGKEEDGTQVWTEEDCEIFLSSLQQENACLVTEDAQGRVMDVYGTAKARDGENEYCKVTF